MNIELTKNAARDPRKPTGSLQPSLAPRRAKALWAGLLQTVCGLGLMACVLSITAKAAPVMALGTGYNAFDADTAVVVSETPELQLLFTHNVALAKKRISRPIQAVAIIGESDGTGKPNAAKFATVWAQRPSPDEPVRCNSIRPPSSRHNWRNTAKSSNSSNPNTV